MGGIFRDLEVNHEDNENCLPTKITPCACMCVLINFHSVPVERIEDRHEKVKKEKKELHDRNIEVSTSTFAPVVMSL